MEKQTILVYLETAEDQVIKVSLEALNAAVSWRPRPVRT